MSFLSASILTVSAAERSLAFPEPRGNLPWHTASLAPRGSAASLVGQMDLIPRGADGRASLFRLPLSPDQKTHHAPKSLEGRATGLPFEPPAEVRLQTSRRAYWTIGCEPPQSGLPQKRDRLRPKKTILCVDDHEQEISRHTFLLETRGYRIIAVKTAQEAVEVLERSLPGTLDLILCDLLMPQMDGNELVRRAKQLHPGLPAMIVSGTVNAFDRALHADVFLPKGASSPAEMIERIRVLVARKRGPKKAVPPTPSHAPETSSFAHATAS